MWHKTARNGERKAGSPEHIFYLLLITVSFPTVIYVQQLAWVMWEHTLLCLFVFPKEQWKIKHLHGSITRLSILETSSWAQKGLWQHFQLHRIGCACASNAISMQFILIFAVRSGWCFLSLFAKKKNEFYLLANYLLINLLINLKIKKYKYTKLSFIPELYTLFWHDMQVYVWHLQHACIYFIILL